ncbi:hypothetical protein Taro_003795 [Colocasia esculenta]|uniref:Uncharacterized protein n=1 Tax=Colocasia esculenta TaxID=4460 RepID=A0A843TGH2_COLES|nr:hypothetical protein [Colocasia esculenta]
MPFPDGDASGREWGILRRPLEEILLILQSGKWDLRERIAHEAFKHLILGSALAVQAKKVNHTWLSGTRLKDRSKEHFKITRLLYTNSGSAVLALASNAQANGVHMAKDAPDSSNVESIAYVALSKDESYVMSASGRKSLIVQHDEGFSLSPASSSKTKLKEHQKEDPCLAFSQSLHVFVCSGADAQLMHSSLFAQGMWNSSLSAIAFMLLCSLLPLPQ